MSEEEAKDTGAIAAGSAAKEEDIPDMSLLSITDGENERGIPLVKFIDDVGAFADSFTPPASAELLIGAYTELHSKFKTYEISLTQKRTLISSFLACFLYFLATFYFLILLFQLITRTISLGLVLVIYETIQYASNIQTTTNTEANLKSKIPEMETAWKLIKMLQKKRDEKETMVTRYSLADDVYGKAELDLDQGSVNLWLGANVMLEYNFEEAIAFLSNNEAMAKQEFIEVKNDLAFVRDQIVTSEVSMTRIFNWDVRKKRAEKAAGKDAGSAKK